MAEQSVHRSARESATPECAPSTHHNLLLLSFSSTVTSSTTRRRDTQMKRGTLPPLQAPRDAASQQEHVHSANFQRGGTRPPASSCQPPLPPARYATHTPHVRGFPSCPPQCYRDSLALTHTHTLSRTPPSGREETHTHNSGRKRGRGKEGRGHGWVRV